MSKNNNFVDYIRSNICYGTRQKENKYFDSFLSSFNFVIFLISKEKRRLHKIVVKTRRTFQTTLN